MSDEKICVLCGANVAGRPRVKDSKGRYACRECAARAKGGSAFDALGETAIEDSIQLAEPAPGRRFDPNITQEVVPEIVDPKYFEKLPEGACPECGAFVPKDVTQCPGCGHNLGAGVPQGNAAGTIIRWRRPLLGLELLEGIPRVRWTPLRQFIGWSVLFLGLFSIGTTNESTMYGYAAIAAIFAVIVYTRTVRAALDDKRMVWAVCGMFGIVLPPLALSMPFYGLFMKSRTFLRVLWLAAILANVGTVLLIRMFHPHLFAPPAAAIAAPGHWA